MQILSFMFDPDVLSFYHQAVGAGGSAMSAWDNRQLGFRVEKEIPDISLGESDLFDEHGDRDDGGEEHRTSDNEEVQEEEPVEDARSKEEDSVQDLGPHEEKEEREQQDRQNDKAFEDEAEPQQHHKTHSVQTLSADEDEGYNEYDDYDKCLFGEDDNEKQGGDDDEEDDSLYEEIEVRLDDTEPVDESSQSLLGDIDITLLIDESAPPSPAKKTRKKGGGGGNASNAEIADALEAIMANR